MKVVEFKANHILADRPVSFDSRPVLHPDGRPVTGGELKVGEVYAIKFDEKKAGGGAVLLPRSSKMTRAQRRRAKR